MASNYFFDQPSSVERNQLVPTARAARLALAPSYRGCDCGCVSNSPERPAMHRFHRAPRRLRMIAAAFAVLILTGAAPPPEAQPKAQVVAAARLRGMVATTVNGLVTHTAVDDPAARTLIVRRDKAGEVEVHDVLNDVVVAQSGAATLVVGGRAEDALATAPGEWRGGTIVGAERRALAPGDVAWIPAGVPHQLIVAPGGSFTYVVVKTDKVR